MRSPVCQFERPLLRQEEIIAPNGKRESIPRGISARARIALPPAVCGAPAPCLPGRTSQIGSLFFIRSTKSSGSGLLEFEHSSNGFCRRVLAFSRPSLCYHALQSRFLVAYQNGCENLYKSAVPIYSLVEDSRSELVMHNWPRKP